MRDSTTQPDPGTKSTSEKPVSGATKSSDDQTLLPEPGNKKAEETRPGANELREAGETLGNP